MNAPTKCLCKELSTPQPTPVSRLEDDDLGKYVSLSWTPSGPLRMDPVAQQATQLLEQLDTYHKHVAAVKMHKIATPLLQEPVVKDRAKWQMNYFWKKACDAENVPFTRKEHVAYPRVLATYHRLRKEYDEADETMVKGRSTGW